MNGNRSQPPSWLEIHATKARRSSIPVAVTLMDSSTVTVHLDSASNAREVVAAISNELSLVDKFGFSVFIAVVDKVTSLGAGNEHIFDAVSNCEQYCREKYGISERNAPWRLFFRKEIFAPWHDSTSDAVSTNLIYHQICRGIKYGEYKCADPESLYVIIAKIFVIEFGRRNTLDDLVPSLLPEENDNLEIIEHVKPIIAQLTTQELPVKQLKSELVNFARTEWPLLFSRFFEAYMERYADRPTILAVNWIGLSIMADDGLNGTIELDHISYPEIISVCTEVSPRKCVIVHSIKSPGKPFNIYSNETEAIYELLAYFLGEMKLQSRFLIATENHEPSRNNGTMEKFMSEDSQSNTLVIKTEKLVEPVKTEIATYRKLSVEDEPDRPVNNLRINGECRSKKNSNFPKASSNSKSAPNLQEYCKYEFSNSNNCTNQSTPIISPLLKRINTTPLIEQAQRSFEIILQYTERTPTFELIESFVQTALSHPLLRDECYCQLLKQFNGAKGLIENRLWELMWLLTGCCAPYCSKLKKILENWLRIRSQDATSFAFDCLQREKKSARKGSRKYPPTQIEVEAIQKGTTQIFHKIHFPDGKHETFEVESSSRAKDLCSAVAKRLGIKSPVSHFAMYVCIAGRTVHVPPVEFFFDFLRSVMTLITKAPSSVIYKAIFRRKLWMNVVPGEDPLCDMRFHFPQERENFLDGYHNHINMDSIVNLSAALHIIRCCENNNTNLTLTADECLPSTYSGEALESHVELVKQRARVMLSANTSHVNLITLKTDFLRTLASKSATFGCTFFPIKCPSRELKESMSLVMAVGQSGIHLLDPCQRFKIIAHYPYKQLTNWSSGSCHLHLTIGDLRSGRKLLFETVLGYRIDDLLTSYLSLLIEKQLTYSKPKTEE